MISKHIRVGLSLLLLALVAFSCSKPNEDPVQATKGGPVSVSSSEKGATAYIMLQGLALWAKDGDSLKYVKAATIGDQVTVLGSPKLFTVDKAEREYTLISDRDGKEYYVRSPYVAGATRLAVVNDDKCVLYNEARIVGATKTIVPRLTIVALLDGEISSDGFIKVSYADQSAQTMISEKWIKNDTLVQREADLQAAVVLAVVSKLPETSKDLKINILEGALKSFADSVYVSELNEVLAKLNIGETLDLVTESATVKVMFDKVNVRSTPDAVSASIVGQLNIGDFVDFVERTKSEYTVAGNTSHWYRITSPMNGWVFGASLDLGD